MLVEVLLTKSHLPNCVTKLNLMFPGHLAQLGSAWLGFIQSHYSHKRFISNLYQRMTPTHCEPLQNGLTREYRPAPERPPRPA
jgi:hypothetical protein